MVTRGPSGRAPQERGARGPRREARSAFARMLRRDKGGKGQAGCLSYVGGARILPDWQQGSYRFVPAGTAWDRLGPDKFFSPQVFWGRISQPSRQVAKGETRISQKESPSGPAKGRGETLQKETKDLPVGHQPDASARQGKGFTAKTPSRQGGDTNFTEGKSFRTGKSDEERRTLRSGRTGTGCARRGPPSPGRYGATSKDSIGTVPAMVAATVAAFQMIIGGEDDQVVIEIKIAGDRYDGLGRMVIGAMEFHDAIATEAAFISGFGGHLGQEGRGNGYFGAPAGAFVRLGGAKLAIVWFAAEGASSGIGLDGRIQLGVRMAGRRRPTLAQGRLVSRLPGTIFSRPVWPSQKRTLAKDWWRKWALAGTGVSST
jgi:hypothetical protein